MKTIIVFLILNMCILVEAKSLSVEMIDSDGETKTFTFFGDAGDKKISIKAPSTILCEASPGLEDAFFEFGCSTSSLDKDSKKSKPMLSRSFTRVPCVKKDGVVLFLLSVAIMEPKKSTQKDIRFMLSCRE